MQIKPTNAAGSVSLAFEQAIFEPIMIVHFWAPLGKNSLHSDQVMDQEPFSVLYSSRYAICTLVLNNCLFELNCAMT